MIDIGRHRDLALLLTASAVSQTGDWILATGVAYEIYALTGSTLSSAVALFAAVAPQVAIGPLAGVLADRWDRRHVMVVVNLLLAVVLVPLTTGGGRHSVVIYAVVAVSGCLSPLFSAAETALLPNLVGDPATRVSANAVNGQVRNVSRLAGAALGGVLVAAGGITLVAVVDLVSFVTAALIVIGIRHRRDPSVRTRSRIVADWRDGLSAVHRSAILRVLLGFFVLSGLGEGVFGGLVAPFVRDVIGGGAQAYGTIMAAQATGGIAGGALVAVLGRRVRPRRLFGYGAVLFGLLDLALFAYPLLWSGVWPAVVIIAAVGLPAAATTAGLMTVFQAATGDELRARTFATLATAQNAAMLGSTLLAGAAAGSLGIVPVLCVQGAAYCLGGLVVLLRLGDQPDQAVPLAPGATATASATPATAPSATPPPPAATML